MRVPLLYLLCIWLFFGCGENESAIQVDLDVREQVIFEEEPDVIHYAYLPQYSHTISYTRHHDLIEYLRKETGLNIKQIFPDTFDQHMNLIGQGKIDISYSNPFIYINIARRYGAAAFARIIEIQGQEKFRGQIICRADNVSIKSIEDCRGKRWIAVDSTSAGGYLYPLGHFIDHGITPKDFKEISFAPGPGGKQEKVILSVYAGKYDVGTIREGSLDVISNKIDSSKIRVIATTKAYPGWVYAARQGLEKRKIEKIKKAFEKLDYHNESHKEILDAANFIKIIPSADSDFDSVRSLAEKASDAS